jgi:hypothetical protein
MARVNFRILLFGLLAILSQSPFAWAQEKIVILVPGFFNTPGQKGIGLQYFSQNIVNSVRKLGYTPIVIGDLNPVGSLQVNGDLLLNDLRVIGAQYPQSSITVLAHSAGGLYVAHALTVQPDLPIANVVTISTPYAGADLVDLVKWIPGFATVTDALDLSALQEFESAKMQSTLAALRIPQRVRWVSLGAAQPACVMLSCALAEYQTWLLSIPWSFAKKLGDGVVSVDSATARGVTVAMTEGGDKLIELWPDYVIPLEHWKIVLDAGIFSLFNEINTHWITTTQRDMVTTILTRLAQNPNPNN